MTLRLGVLSGLLVILLTGCSPTTAPAPGQTSDAPTTSTAGLLTWGDGDYGVVLAHGAGFDAASWSDQATAIAAQGATVVAVEDISTAGIEAAVTELQNRGITEVALAGGSAGADAILQLATEQPDLPDQLVLISPNTVVQGLGSELKLFIASHGEPGADIPQQLVDAAPGPDNRAVLLPGSAHAQNIFDTDQSQALLTLMLERLKR